MSDNQAGNIIRVAMEKMRQVGIRSVSIDDVCHELGMSKKTFYVYFSTKDDLVQAMLLRLESEVNENIRTQFEQKTVLELLLNFQKIMRNTRDVRKVPPLFYDLEKYYPRLYHEHAERSRNYAEQNIRMAIRKGIEEGLFREDLDIEKTSGVVIMMRESFMNLPIEKREDKRTMDVMKYSVDILMRGIISAQGEKMIREKMKK